MPVMNKADLLKEALRPILEERSVRLAVLFGSAAAGRSRPDSDIDIAVEMGEAFDFDAHGEFTSALAKAAARAGVEGDIDLAYLQRADPLFLKKIFESAVFLSGEGGRFSVWRLRAFRAYLDFLPYLRMEAASDRGSTLGMIDPQLVVRKAGLIEKDLLALLESIEKLKPGAPLDVLSQAQVERLLERMIGRMIDINFHLITEGGRPAPKDYHESFLELGRSGTLDHSFAARISSAAGLRNRIAHEYDEILPDKLLAAAKAALSDIPQYLKQVLNKVSPS